MRNLLEYPITADEAIQSAKWASSEYTKNIENYGIGGVEGISLLLIEKYIEADKSRFDTFAKATLQVTLGEKDE